MFDSVCGEERKVDSLVVSAIVLVGKDIVVDRGVDIGRDIAVVVDECVNIDGDIDVDECVDIGRDIAVENRGVDIV